MTPGPLRQVRLVLGLGVRRWINRIASGAAARRSASDGGVKVVRPPTARRRVGMGLLLVLAGVAFRGLLFRGLRRDLTLPWAAIASAGLFAIIHPSLGVVPVFGLGLAAAVAYERTGWLLAPVLAHATYNGVVVLLAGG